jgi:sulfoxide reductase heme-binding subunit YedZ
LTSTGYAIRKIGAERWNRLHKLIYPAAAAAALHFVMVVKSWPLEPLVYAAIVTTLLGYRAFKAFRKPPARERRVRAESRT